MGCESDAELLRQALLDGLQVEDLGIVEVGPAIGAHAGTGALVVAIQSVEVARAGNAPDA